MLSDGDPDQYEGLQRSDAALQSTIPAASVQSSLKQPSNWKAARAVNLRALAL